MATGALTGMVVLAALWFTGGGRNLTAPAATLSAHARNVLVQSGEAGAPRARGERWLSHVKALADDAMEGRNTGSPGHRRAAEYVAAVFERAGLTPAGTHGFMQPVAFVTRTIDEPHSSLALVTDRGTDALTLGDDATFSLRIDPPPSVEAGLVFAGYGLRIPELRLDDLAGVDVRNKVVVYLGGSPRSVPGPLRAHYQSAAERWAALNAAGAIGTISIANPGTMEMPWARSTLARLQPSMSLADPSLDDTAGQQVAIAMNPARADKLFAGSGHTFQEILALADAGMPLPAFPLPARVRAKVSVTRARVESQNVVGVIRGSDPALRDEYVVVSAHLDHLGMGEPINGDRIYNGAMDNAAGVAAILDIAAELHDAGRRGRRSLLFIAVTGEEKGELGSRYFAAHPTVPRPALVADVNTDMFLPLFPLKMLMVLGLDESDLGRDIRAVAQSAGVAVQTDPEPDRNRFIRSDQYSFVRAGIPALAMKVGYDQHTPEAEIARKWTSERYHAPSDDLSQPIDVSAAGQYVVVVRDLALRIADRPDRPMWNAASFFRRFAP